MLSPIHSTRYSTFSRIRRQARLGCLASAVLFLAGVATTVVIAQGNTSGAFIGIVRDKGTGKPVPGAKVVLRNQDFDTQSTVITQEDGKFSKGSLPTGSYEIEISANGYVTAKRVQTLYSMASYPVEPTPFDLEAETVAAGPTPVTPTGPPPVVTPTPAVSMGQSAGRETSPIDLNPRHVGLFDRGLVVGLPLGGTTLTRTFDELAFLVPGVNPPPQAIGNTVGPGVGGGVGTSGQFSVNGLRSRANNFTVDGSDNNDEDIGVRRQGFFSLVPQPIESIQEFQIVTLLAPAEFGRNLGAQVNALSKSGGRRFTGSVFGFYNDDSLNARNAFDNASGDYSSNVQALRFGVLVPVLVDGAQKRVTNNAGTKDKFSLLQGGFAIGGPIVTNKMFFFVSAEGQRLNGTQERHYAVPTVEQRSLFNSPGGLQQCQGTLVGGTCTVNYTPGFPTSVDGDAVFSLFPFANDPNGIFGRNTYTQALSSDARGRILSGRFDWNLFSINSNQQKLTLRYNNTDDKRDLPDVAGALFSAIRPLVRTDNFSSFLNGGINDNVSNEFRFSWGRTRLRFDELRDTTGFLRPISSSVIANARDRRFMLNAPVVYNFTIPGSCTPTGCVAAPQVLYRTFADLTEASRLGPIGQLNIAGFSPVGVDVFNFPQERTNDTYQVADTVRWESGIHSFALGTDVRRTFLDSDLPRNSRPLVTFYGGICQLGTFCAGSLIAPNNFAAAGAATGFLQSLALPNNNSRINLSYNQFNIFGQDQIRVNSRLNISLGLRYEYNTTPVEADNKIEKTFNIQRSQFPNVSFADLFQGFSEVIAGRTKIFIPEKDNIAPRVGFAYSPVGNMVIRGGYGVYYDQIIGSVVSQSRNVFPTFVTANTGGGDLFCNASGNNPIFQLLNPITGTFFSSTSCSPIGNGRMVVPGTLNTLNPRTGADIIELLKELYLFPFLNGTSFGTTLPTRRLDTPFSHQFSIGIEQRLFGNTFLSAAYVGTEGSHLLRYATPNLGNNYLAAGERFVLINNEPRLVGITIDPFVNPNDLNRPNRNIGPVFQFESTGKSRYDSLQLGLRGRFMTDLTYQVNYAYSNVKDDVSDVFDLAGAFALPQNSLTRAGEYAPANFDVRHRFTYNFVYDLPGLHSYNSAMRSIFGGWQLAGAGRFNTGQPFTVNTYFDINHDGNLTDRLNNTRFISTNGATRGQPLVLQANADLRQMLATFGSDGAVPRNNFRAGSVLDLDMAVSRRFRVTETQNLQFRLDFFNFINRANFGVPVRILEAPGFGRANDTLTPGRRIQFGLKYNF